MDSFLRISACRGTRFGSLRHVRWLAVLFAWSGLFSESGFAQTSIPGSGSATLFNRAALSNNSAPSLGDVDGDGDLDALIGTADGYLLYFKNVGSANNPLYVQQSGSDNLFNGQVQSENGNAAPSLGDVDSDGDLDAIVGTANGTFLYFKNEGSAVNPLYVQQFGSDNPFYVLSQYKEELSDAAPTLGDVDKDGDLDVILGTASGKLLYFKNEGSAVNPLYVQQSGPNTPFNDQTLGNEAAPSLGDVDEDGDLDAIVGNTDGTILYFKNEGSAVNPLYVQQFGGDNPFIGPDKVVTSFANTSPSLGDVDGDGDLDAVVGTAEGTILFYKNIGTSTNPLYVQQSGASNPFQPDLSPTIYARPSTFYGTTNMTVAVDVMELDGIPTTGPITLYITKNSMITLTFDPNETRLPGRVDDVQNSQWSFDDRSNSSYYVLTSQTSIEGQGVLSVGLRGQFNPNNTKGLLSISAMIGEGSGGEGKINNNIDAERIDYFNK